MNQDFDPFRELQLSPDAEPELVKAAFKALARKYHPDRFQDPKEKAQAEERMKRINEAQRLIASGQYQPPTPPASESEQPARPQTPPSPTATAPSTPPRRPHRVALGPIFAVFAMLLLAIILPRLFSSDRLAKALKLEEQGNYQQALEHLNSAIEQNPRNGEAYFHRARIWLRLDQPERAEVDRRNATGLLSEPRLQELSQTFPPPVSSSPSPSPSPQAEAEVPASDSTNGAGHGLP